MDLGDRIAEVENTLVASTTQRLYAAHPEWNERWGAAGRESCTKDIRFTLSFLRAALRSGDPEIFHGYARWLAELLEARGVPADSARGSFELLAEELARMFPGPEANEVASILRSARDAIASGKRLAPRQPSLTPAAQRFLAAVLASDRAAVHEVLREALEEGLDPAHLADALVQPAMAEVGALWARNKITVAQEHRATALAQAALARVAPQASMRRDRRVAFACVEGNLHALGLRVVADAFEADGWNVDYLGADVPTRDLLAFLRENPVDLLGLSVALPPHLDTAQRVVASLRRALGEACPRIVVGGRPIAEHSLGAAFIAADDLFSDAATGLARAR